MSQDNDKIKDNIVVNVPVSNLENDIMLVCTYNTCIFVFVYILFCKCLCYSFVVQNNKESKVVEKAVPNDQNYFNNGVSY